MLFPIAQKSSAHTPFISKTLVRITTQFMLCSAFFGSSEI